MSTQAHLSITARAHASNLLRALEERRRLRARSGRHRSADRVAEHDPGEELSDLLDHVFPTWRARRSSWRTCSALEQARATAEPDAGSDCRPITPVGTTPGVSTPKPWWPTTIWRSARSSRVLTQCQFWPKMAIFIVEDDAQNGVDHVDGHRTVAFAGQSLRAARAASIRPSIRTQSMVKTDRADPGTAHHVAIRLIAEDMRNSFQMKPDLTPFAAVNPEISLFDRNPPSQALSGNAKQAAIASSKMRFDIPDAAPTEKLNRILWHTMRGWDTPYPGTRHAVFAPLTVSTDDDDRR